MVPDSPQMMVCLNTQALLMPPALTCPDWSITMVVSEASAMWLRSTARAAGSKIWERGIINNEGFRPPQNINDEQHNEGINQNKNREEVNYRQIRYLPDLSIVNFLSVFVLRGGIITLIILLIVYILGKSKHLIGLVLRYQ